VDENKNNNFKKEEPVFSLKHKAGKRRTYFFDVRENKNSDYYITITESKKREDGTYARHKIYLYKEDVNKFMEHLGKVVNHVKTELMPNYDFDEFARRQEEYERQRAEENNNNGHTDAGNSDSPAASSNAGSSSASDVPPAPPASDEELKW